MSCEMKTPYADAAGILLLIKGELIVGEVKSSRLVFISPRCRLQGEGQDMKQAC